MTNIFLHVEPMLWGACLWYWLWTLGAFLLGSLLTWLFTRNKVDVSAIEAERDRYKADSDRYHKAATKWETDYQSLKYQLEEAQKAEADYRSRLAACESDNHALRLAADATPPDTGALGIASGIAAGVAGGDTEAGSIYDGMFSNDNFQIIEGVGPKVNKVLIDAGYKTWDDLAAADSADIRKHLDEAGKRFGLCDPTSWPHQAKLAAAGDWEELIRYQKFTDAGRETVGDFETDSKFEKLAAKKLGFSSSNPNDLKVVEGVGPKIEGLLKEGGINTWAELAATEVSRIQEILDAAGPRYKLAVPRTWPQQAGLAAEGRWAELKALQDELQAGK
ncbi:MAG: helix-hairpin-helix domain-containing protein [Bacteroidota bacterium]